MFSPTMQQAHMFCIHSLTPHAGLHNLLPPRGAVWVGKEITTCLSTLQGDEVVKKQYSALYSL